MNYFCRTSRLAQVNPSTFTCSHNAREEGTVAVLFIIVDKFPHENIWREWLEAKSAIAAATRIRVLIHAKFPEKVTSDWVRARLVTSFHYTPEWGHSDLVRVMLGLMKEITNTEPTVCKAIFASESCLPIVPAEHFLSLATRDGDSWVNFTNDSKNGFVQQKQVSAEHKHTSRTILYSSFPFVRCCAVLTKPNQTSVFHGAILL